MNYYFTSLIFFISICISNISSYSFKSGNNGYSVNDRKRDFLRSNVSLTPGDNGFRVKIEDLTEKMNVPKKGYKSK
jgi:hypothetical protein